MKSSNLLSYFIFTFLCGISLAFGQIRTNNQVSGNIVGSAAFLDASSNVFSNSINNGKGLAFPRTDLTTFTFAADGNFISFPTYYDGMVVYNTASGTTPASGSGVGEQQVEPGFYYFSNPTSESIISNGRWIPFSTATDGITMTGTLSTTTTGLVSEVLTLNLSVDNTPPDVFDLSSFEEVKTGQGTPSTQTFIPSAASGDLYVDTSSSTLWTYNGTNWTLIEAATENIYTDDGTITTSRIITLDGDKTLTYSGGASNTVIFDTDTRFNQALKDSDGDVGLPGQVLTSTGASSNTVNWVYPGGISALKTGDYTLAEEGTLYVRPSGDVTITLPDPSEKEGRRVTVKRADDYTPGNTLAIVSAAGATIDNVTSQNLNMSYQGYTYEAFGGQWHIIQRF